jgi:ribosomal protein S18 acetylase RimI-like enzyme
MTEIVTLTSKHSLSAANLHLQCLSTPFKGLAGRQLLCSYYKAVARGNGAVGYVAQEGDQVLGYVCGVWAPSKLRITLLKTQWPALIFWGLTSVLLNPELLDYFVLRLHQTIARDAYPATPGYELRPIVVAPAARGIGLATRLVERLMLDARNRGFEYMHLFVESDNTTAQSFYQKMGFVKTGIHQDNYRTLLVYSLLLTSRR